MKLSTWNVNSIRSRLSRLLRWLERESPDVICLQELKGTEESFPVGPLRQAGYHAAVHGQKAYNGVATLSRTEPLDVVRGMGVEDGAPQARLVAATIGGLRVLSAYAPNGRSVGSEAWQYKLDWLERLGARVESEIASHAELVVAGDLNVAPDDDDVANPERWAGSVLCHPDARDAFGRLLDRGLVDLFRRHHPDGGLYSWWDYRRLAFPRNDGLRIDHVLATGRLAERCTDARIDRDERKGGKKDVPSDHVPVVVELDLPAPGN